MNKKQSNQWQPSNPSKWRGFFLTLIGLLILIIIGFVFYQTYHNTSSNQQSSKKHRSEKQINQQIGDIIKTRHAPPKGDKNAPVRVVTFTDFKCDHCQVFHQKYYPMLKEKADKGEIAYYNINHPIVNSDSIKFSHMSDAIAKKGTKEEYWQFVNESYHDMNETQPYNIVQRLNLSTQKEKAINDEYKTIKDDPYDKQLKQANQFGVHSTPNIFVNGKHIENQEKLEETINKEVAKHGKND